MMTKWMCRFQVGWILATLLLVFLPGPGLKIAFAQPAPSSANITITATPAFGLPEAPSDFTVTYVNEFEVGLTWTQAPGATHTLIRGEWGDCPESETDGFEVYYGTGESHTHHVDMEATSEEICYRAWSYNDSGYSTGYMEGTVGGISMFLIAFALLALGLTTLGLTTKQLMLLMASGMAWIGLGGYELINSDSLTDIHHFFGWLGIALGLVFISSPAWFNRIEPKPGPETDFEEAQLEYERFSKGFGARPPPQRRRRA